MNWIHWSLLSALFAGLTAVFAKIGVTGINSNLATAVRTTVALVFTWIIAWTTAAPAEALSYSKKTWIFLIASGLMTGLSWLCYFRALQLGPASQVAPIDKLSVVFTLIFAAILLNEKLGWQHVVGGALMVAGAMVIASK